MPSSRSFASDNNSGVHPDILAAMLQANRDHVIGYGDDPYTRQAVQLFRQHFGEPTQVFFVYGGTGANVLGLSALLKPHQAVICAATAHIQVDECGAPEKFSGSKLIPLPTQDGKITPAQIEPLLHILGDQHHAQPKVISITQPTEVGMLYSVAEIRTLAEFAHARGMYLHMDGARICNAAAALGLDFAAFTRAAGVDVLSFGGAKNGMMYGEAVLFFDPRLAAEFPFIRKQGMQLASKMRYIAAQFSALLSGDLWLRNAQNANRLAALLADQVSKIPWIKLTRQPQANAVFAILPRQVIPRLQERYFFYVWEEQIDEVRWMTSFDTTEQDVTDFVSTLQTLSPSAYG
jgi:threonine aldolase